MNEIEKLISRLCPDGVENIELREVCTNFIVPMRDRPPVFDGDIPWCRIEDIQRDRIHGSLSGLKVSKKVISDMNLKVMPAGTVIASCSASLGKYAITTAPLITNQTFIGLVCGERLLNRYLLHLLPLKTPELIASSNSGTIPYISRAKFEKLRIPIPPIEIQYEIARILDTLNELEEELEAELYARKTQFEFIRTELFRDCIEKYRSAPLGGLVSHLRTGLNPRQNFVLNPPGAKCSYITVRELDGFGIRTTDKTDKVDESGFVAIQNRSKLKAGDVLFSATGTIGRTALVEDTPTNWGIKEGVYAITTNTAELHPRFLIYLFGHSSIYDDIIARSEGSTVRSISMASLKALMVPAPPLAIQKSVVDKLDVAYELTFELLPKEITARKQQYEHYRSKLLTFGGA